MCVCILMGIHNLFLSYFTQLFLLGNYIELSELTVLHAYCMPASYLKFFFHVYGTSVAVDELACLSIKNSLLYLSYQR